MPALGQEEQSIFESEVRRVATELFPKAQVAGPVTVDRRERDGVYIDGETIHVIEATVSTRKQKAASDLEKSADLVRFLRRTFPDHNFKIWLITKIDPTADQCSLIPNIRRKAKCPVELCSYRTFSSRLVNAAKYLETRLNHPFGSIRRPEDDLDFRVPADEYVHTDLLDPISKNIIPANELADTMESNPQIFLLLGDYGTGKSMTLRHAFFGLQRNFLSGDSRRFPLYLNLRDHFGQRSPAEALMRHGEEIGFPLPSELVAAWKAGHCHLLLDGFDELSSTRLARGVSSLRQARREAMRLVHGFIQSQPSDTSLLISGRQNYFDSLEELGSAFGFSKDFSYFTLNEFDQEQVIRYLKRKGFEDSIPDWLPSRPLLLGYLAIKGILSLNTANLGAMSREEGWDHLLDRICEREAHQIDPISIDPHAVREFVERVATLCRRTSTGRGPIHLSEMRKCFEDVFLMPPDEKAETLIFRMPGFTAASGQEDAREFIDDDYVDASRGGDVVRFVKSPHDPRYEVLLTAGSEMRDLGCGLAATKTGSITSKQLCAALDIAGDRDAPYISFDILRMLQQRGDDYVGAGVIIRDGLFENFEITGDIDFSKIILEECLISQVEIADIGADGPIFRNCHIDRLFGAIGKNDMPPALKGSASGVSIFVDEALTNADILELPIPLSLKVLMTVLRKLFVQPGRGRKENALYRGLDGRARSYVSEILELLEQMDFAHPHRIGGPAVWFSNRSRTKQAHRILKSPQQTSEPLASKVRSL